MDVAQLVILDDQTDPVCKSGGDQMSFVVAMDADPCGYHNMTTATFTTSGVALTTYRGNHEPQVVYLRTADFERLMQARMLWKAAIIDDPPDRMLVPPALAWPDDDGQEFDSPLDRAWMRRQ